MFLCVVFRNICHHCRICCLIRERLTLDISQAPRGRRFGTTCPSLWNCGSETDPKIPTTDDMVNGISELMSLVVAACRCCGPCSACCHLLHGASWQWAGVRRCWILVWTKAWRSCCERRSPCSVC